jgi:HD superfamily phosphohydrolase YqeK
MKEMQQVFEKTAALAGLLHDLIKQRCARKQSKTLIFSLSLSLSL